jgi:hypothetical protein
METSQVELPKFFKEKAADEMIYSFLSKPIFFRFEEDFEMNLMRDRASHRN